MFNFSINSININDCWRINWNIFKTNRKREKKMIIEEKLYNQISEITNIDYEIENGYVKKDNIIIMFEDLINEIRYLQENIKDIKQDIEDNYKSIKVKNQI